MTHDRNHNRDLVETWIKYQLSGLAGDFDGSLSWASRIIDEMVEKEPEAAFELVLEILESLRDDKLLPVLAAGEVEELLVEHGSEVVELFENVAAKNPRFKHLLGGVWEADIDPDVWRRIEKLIEKRW